MEYQQLMQRVAVLGAAGKMGSGIAALLSQELVRLKLQYRLEHLRLTLIDTNEAAFPGLLAYLADQARRAAEKQIVTLRGFYSDRADLVDNGEIIEQYIADLLSLVRVDTDLRVVAPATMVFEAIVENLEVKLKVFKQLAESCAKETYFFTNTSSIPIGLISQRTDLVGRVIGYHFYNPPIVQKLLELIVPETTRKELVGLAVELAAHLRKTVVRSADVAGFIGNGHFTRDGLYGLNLAERLVADRGLTLPEAVVAVNRVTQDFLLRPMGIFQLLDYVGIEVYQSILAIIAEHGEQPHLRSPLCDRMLAAGIRGGQHQDGSQKDGFLGYEKGRPARVYDLESGTYRTIDEALLGKVDGLLGPLPSSALTWKALSRDGHAGERLAAYFGKLEALDTLGASLARDYLKNSKVIAETLVQLGVTPTVDDVSAVLKLGFFHLYGVADFA